MSKTETIERQETNTHEAEEDQYFVRAFNNDTNSFEQVIEILILATNCTKAHAEEETWEIHTRGMSDVHFSSEKECKKVSEIISSIGVKTTVQKL